MKTRKNIKYAQCAEWGNRNKIKSIWFISKETEQEMKIKKSNKAITSIKQEQAVIYKEQSSILQNIFIWLPPKISEIVE